MRILTITSNHPPYHSGGYELRIKDILDGLAFRGHQVLVLSTRSKRKLGLTKDRSPYPVKRLLHDCNNAKFFPKEVFFDLLDTKIVEKTIKWFQPDVVYLGHIYILSKSILPYLASLAIPIVYDEGGTGLKGVWTENGRWFRFCGDYQSKWNALNKLKPWVIKFVLYLGKGRIQPAWRWPENMKVFFNSQNNLNHSLSFGVPVQSAKVIHSGIDLEKFPFRSRTQLTQPFTIICPGRLEPRKGQLDAVNLLSELKNVGIVANLILVGESPTLDYLEQLEKKIKAENLQESVTMLGMVSQEELAKMYQQSDICFFPSHHPTGFSRTPLEAMACGCIVISYGNEGSGEIIRNDENGYLIEAGNLTLAIKLIQRLVSNPAEIERIIKNARKEIEQQYSITEYIDHIESFLKWTLSQN